jgi:hypothetical protein
MNRIASLVTLAALISASACSTSKHDANPGTVRGTTPETATTVAGLDDAIRATRTAAAMPNAWTTWRVGGDLFAMPEERDGSFYWKKCSITTPLPQDYPAPTPPAAIELKRYPTVRRAEMRMEADKGVNSQQGRNLAFWPLFNHISKNDIEMTSPVEMDYPRVKIDSDPQAATKDASNEWTMSFLYRTTDLGPTGTDGKVQITDAAPLTVLSIGMMGPYMASRDFANLKVLRDWLEANPQWRAAGPARSLYYNGPDVVPARQWSEFQIPVERVN